MNQQISRRSFLKLLSLLLSVSLLDERPHLFGGTTGPSQGTPNVLILVFDALSAKHMSVYGYHRATTPHLARFAEKATVYHAHYAGGNFTTPGVASLLTGTYPWSHRAFNIQTTVAESHNHRNLFRVFAGKTYNRIAYTDNWLANLLLYQFREDIDDHINPGEFSLFDGRLSDRLLFLNDTDIVYRSEVLLFNRGSQGSLFLFGADRMWRYAYQRIFLLKENARSYPKGLPRAFLKEYFLLEHIVDGIKALLSNSRQPFLGYFHLWPPHEPYKPRYEFIGIFDDGWTPVTKKPHFFSRGKSNKALNQWRREYDEYLAYADAEFGRLYDFMEQTGILDNTYVIFTSDHGQLFERGIHGHGTEVLYEPVIRIPLLISKPKQQQREDVYTPTSCVDLLPTLLQATGRAVPDWCEGEVLPTLGGKEASGERSIFSVDAKSNPKHAPLTKATVALVKDQYKLIHYFGYDGYENEYELYDLVNDPEEMEDLYLSRKSLAVDLRGELEEKLREVNQPYLK